MSFAVSPIWHRLAGASPTANMPSAAQPCHASSQETAEVFGMSRQSAIRELQRLGLLEVTPTRLPDGPAGPHRDRLPA